MQIKFLLLCGVFFGFFFVCEVGLSLFFFISVMYAQIRWVHLMNKLEPSPHKHVLKLSYESFCDKGIPKITAGF